MKYLIIALTLILLAQFAFGQEAFKVEKSGKGTPVVYLPGFTTPGNVWDETIKNVKGTHENHVFTYAGFDGVAPIGTPWYEPLKDQIIDYIKEQKLTNMTVIGHSMGGNLAIDIAAALPDQITNLILIESIPCMREVMMPGVPASALTYDSPYNQQMINMSDEAFLQTATQMAQNMTNREDKMEVIKNYILNSDRETYVYGYTDLLKLDLRDKLSELKTKNLILGASFPTKEMVLTTYESQYQNLKNKEIFIAEDSKHFIMFDQPEWMYGKINEFLEKEIQ